MKRNNSTITAYKTKNGHILRLPVLIGAYYKTEDKIPFTLEIKADRIVLRRQKGFSV